MSRAEPAVDPHDLAGSVPSPSLEGEPGDAAEGAGHPFATPEPERYQTTAHLGRGGMGQVDVAYDLRVGRNVARKRPHGPGGGWAMADEAQIAARLEHPGIVPIHDAGVDAEGLPFYTMRLVRGRDLAAVLAEPATWPDRQLLVRHFLQACEAMAYAHSIGVVHRDLKPANIVVGRFGETQVVDWGLALALAVGPGQPADATLTSPTADGAQPGTPAYMAPEVADGALADRRADVYGLGASLWHLLSGAAPFAGLANSEVLAAVRQRRTGWPVPGADVPADLVSIAARATHPDPAQRYADASELARDVAAWLDGRRVSAYRYSPVEVLRRFAATFRTALAVGGVALALLAAAGAVAGVRVLRERDRAESAESSTLAALARAAWLRGREAEAETLAVAALANKDSADARGVLSASAVSPRPTNTRTSGPDCLRRTFDVAGTRLLCLGARQVALWQVGAREPDWQAPLAAHLGALAHDGTAAVVLDGGDLVRLDAAGRRVGAPFSVGTVRDVAKVGARWLVPAGPALHVLSERADAAEPVSVCAPGVEHLTLAVTPDGRRLAVSCGDGAVAIGTLQPSEWRRSAGPPDRDLQGGRALAWSADGRRLAVGNVRGWVRVLDAMGHELGRAVAEVGPVTSVALSGDGKLLAVAGEHGGARVLEVGTFARRLRVPAAAGATVHLSADGATLSTATDRVVRWTLPPPGRRHHVPVAGDAGSAGLALAPDGSVVATGDGSGRVSLVDPAHGRVLGRVAVGSGTIKGAIVTGSTLVVTAVDAGIAEVPVAAVRSGPAGGADVGATSVSAIGGRRLLALPGGVVVATDWGTTVLVRSLDGKWHTHLEVLPGLARDLAAAGPHVFAAIDDASGDLLRVELPDAAGSAALRVTRWLAGVGGRALASAVDGSEFAVSEHDEVRVVRPGRGTAPLFVLRAPGRQLLSVARSVDGELFAAGTVTGDVVAWRRGDPEPCAVLRGHTARVPGLAFAPDGAWLISSSWDGGLRFWATRPWVAAAQELAAAAEAAWQLPVADVVAGAQ